MEVWHHDDVLIVSAHVNCDMIVDYCPSTVPSVVGYSSVDCLSRKLRDTCEYTCDVGYEGTPLPLTCQELAENTGTWYVFAILILMTRSVLSGCHLIHNFCPVSLPAIDGYENAICDGNFIGSTCSVTCAYGYRGSPSPVECQVNSTWSERSSCNLISSYCPGHLTAKTGYSYAECNDTWLSGECAYSCDIGYEDVGIVPAVCMKDTPTSGIWSEQQSCVLKPNYCTAATISVLGYQVTTCSDAVIGGTCDVPCDNGYTGSHAAITCQYSTATTGQWSSPTHCSLLPDYCPNVIEAMYGTRESYCVSRRVGDACAMVCDAGYSTSFSTSVYCSAVNSTHGEWSVSSICEKFSNYCPSLFSAEPALGFAVTSCSSTMIGTYCVIDCVDGYEPTDYSPFECVYHSDVSGVWDSAMQCTKVR